MPESKRQEGLVTIFAAVGVSAEIEAQAIHALLESSDVDSVLVRENVTGIPVGKVEVRVLASQVARAEELIRESEQAGPAAAEEAEAETEI